MKRSVLELRPTQRRWKDLRKRRLSLGLAAAPVPSTSLGILLLLIFDSGGPLGNVLVGIAAILVAAILWALLVGWIYLLIVARRRGVISRAECLILGVAAAIIIPSVAESISIIVDGFTLGGDYALNEPWGSDSETRFFGAILSVALAPFGLLGGWIFWGIGVRPTATTVGDVAPVFD